MMLVMYIAEFGFQTADSFLALSQLKVKYNVQLTNSITKSDLFLKYIRK